MTKERQWRLRPLLLGMFMGLIGLMLVLIGAATYFSISQMMRVQISDTRQQLLNEAQRQLSVQLRSVEEEALALATNPELQEILGSSNRDVYEDIQARNRLNEVLGRHYYAKAYISSIVLYSDRFQDESNKDTNRIKRLVDMSADNLQALQYADAAWLGLRIDSSSYYTSNSVIVYVTRIYSPQQKLLGYLEINVLEASLSGLLRSSNSQRTAVAVLDGGGRLIMQSAAFPDQLEIETLLKGTGHARLPEDQQASYTESKIKGKAYLLVYSQTNTVQWRLLEVIPISDIYNEMRLVRDVVLASGMLALLLAFPMASYLTRRITGSIGELVEGFNQVVNGNFAARIEASNNIVEFKKLQISFNKMGEELGQLMERLELEHRAKLKAEYDTLQSQINPHFLYNTLDMVNWMAAAKGADDVSTVVAKLARLFRIGLSGGRTLIRIGEELEHASLYVQIQQARYRELFDYKEESDDTLRSLYMPKLLLQPFIENAIVHGFDEPGDEKSEIRVSVQELGEAEVLLVVEDNGNGLADDWVDPLSDGTAGAGAAALLEEGQSGGYGIRNVHHRIRLYYGEAYGVRLLRRSPRGVRVEIRLPRLIAPDSDTSLNRKERS